MESEGTRYLDCSGFFQQNVSVGRGRGNGAGWVPNVRSAKDCQNVCKAVEACKFFIWNSASAPRRKLSCWLKKNDRNKRQKDVGRISGPRSC